MTVSYADAKAEVGRLVERFARLSAHNRQHYNEAATRQEFILPMFRALGWNIEDAREVSPEEQVSRGFVDFSFRLGGIPRFFLETKKIVADLDDPRWAQQAINYAWLKGVTWAVLSDFQGLKLLNAEWQETVPARAIFKDLHWQQYLDRFDDLWLLSRPAMEEHALDRAAEAVGRKVKKTPVSRRLFADLTEWRRDLFKTLRAYNRDRSVEQIDEAVQRILDRLIFIRTCEDRGIEPYRLQPMLREWREQRRKKDLVLSLNALFREFDQAYDSRLFAPHSGEELTSEPAAYERIIDGLYEVSDHYGRYDFNAIDADVLGAIYEQYLGHRVQELRGKQAVDKQAKRKAQGIYYTPQFVVRYIVAQTLGRFLQEHDYQQARQVKVLDMACGSGSFLIDAFDRLDRYLAAARGQNAPLSRLAGEGPRVRAAGDTHDFARRMEILTNNLYGVDLDPQAVEIAQLNLLLKAVNQRGMLPRLDNIRQGNSLIKGKPAEMEAAFGPGWGDKQPFDWEEQFPDVMERGGFDVIVGNPPYVRIQTLPRGDAAWYGDHYKAAGGNYDIYVLFVERALQLLRPGGVMGMILPNKLLQVDYGMNLRKLLSEQRVVSYIVDFEHAQVFEGATTYTCLLFLRQERTQRVIYVTAGNWLGTQVEQPAVLPDGLPQVRVDGRSLTHEPWVFTSQLQTLIKQKLLANGVPLLDLPASMSRGSSTGNDKVFILKHGEPSGRYLADDGEPVRIETELLRAPLFATDFSRYCFAPRSRRAIIFPYRRSGDRRGPVLVSELELHERFPEAYAYLRCKKDVLNQRKQYGAWYGFSAARNLAVHDKADLVVPLLADRASFAELPDDRDKYCLMASGGFSISIEKDSGLSPRYVLGLLNSKLLFWYLSMISNRFRGGWITCTKQYVGRLPIRRINFDEPADVARHDRIVALVEEMLRLQKEHAQANAAKEDRRHDLARQVEQVDAQIDALVYELYGLTEEEVKVVEGRLKRK